MKKYRKIPLIVEAQQWTRGDLSDIVSYDWGQSGPAMIKTPHGKMNVKHGEWIVKDIFGDYYPVKDEIFKKLYEEVNEPI